MSSPAEPLSSPTASEGHPIAKATAEAAPRLSAMKHADASPLASPSAPPAPIASSAITPIVTAAGAAEPAKPPRRGRSRSAKPPRRPSSTKSLKAHKETVSRNDPNSNDATHKRAQSVPPSPEKAKSKRSSSQSSSSGLPPPVPPSSSSSSTSAAASQSLQLLQAPRPKKVRSSSASSSGRLKVSTSGTSAKSLIQRAPSSTRSISSARTSKTRTSKTSKGERRTKSRTKSRTKRTKSVNSVPTKMEPSTEVFEKVMKELNRERNERQGLEAKVRALEQRVQSQLAKKSQDVGTIQNDNGANPYFDFEGGLVRAKMIPSKQDAGSVRSVHSARSSKSHRSGSRPPLRRSSMSTPTSQHGAVPTIVSARARARSRSRSRPPLTCANSVARGRSTSRSRSKAPTKRAMSANANANQGHGRASTWLERRPSLSAEAVTPIKRNNSAIPTSNLLNGDESYSWVCDDCTFINNAENHPTRTRCCEACGAIRSFDIASSLSFETLDTLRASSSYTHTDNGMDPEAGRKHGAPNKAKKRKKQRRDDRKQCCADWCRRIACIIILALAIYGVWVWAEKPYADELDDAYDDASDSIGDFREWIDGWREDPFEGINVTTIWDNGVGKHGLSLEIQNALDSTWQKEFYTAIDEWDKGDPDALSLRTKRVDVEKACSHVGGAMKVCNGNYGKTGWLGINELHVKRRGIIQSSTAKLNEHYLSTGDAARQYTMCHEVGHGFGLPHTDEDFRNKDTGNCLDYSSHPENNLHPGKVNYDKLLDIYGPIGTRRSLRSRRSAAPGVMHVEVEERDTDQDQSISSDDEYKAAMDALHTQVQNDGSEEADARWQTIHSHRRGRAYSTVLSSGDRIIVSFLLAESEEEQHNRC